MDSKELGLSIIAQMVHSFAGGKDKMRWDQFRAYAAQRAEADPDVGGALGVRVDYGRN